MTIAIVIGTHGWAAEQLLKTAEMLLGEQENVGWIDFVPLSMKIGRASCRERVCQYV